MAIMFSTMSLYIRIAWGRTVDYHRWFFPNEYASSESIDTVDKAITVTKAITPTTCYLKGGINISV